MVFPHQSELGWKIAISALHCLAISTTLVRLLDRFRKRQTWWDDYAVALAASCDLTAITLFWMQYHRENSIIWMRPPKYQSFAFSYWFTTFLAFTVLWLSRISLSLSLARIFGARHKSRTISLFMAAACFVLYIASVLASTFKCRGSPWWKLDLRQCINVDGNSFRSFIVVLFAFDFVADVALVLSPMNMLWGIKFEVTQRRLILVLFCSSILTLTASILNCGIYYATARTGPDSQLVYLGMGHVQIAFSLIASNMLVVVTLAYNKIRNFMESRRTVGSTFTDPIDPEKLTTEILSVNSSSHAMTMTNSSTVSVGTFTSVWMSDYSECSLSRDLVSTSVASRETKVIIAGTLEQK